MWFVVSVSLGQRATLGLGSCDAGQALLLSLVSVAWAADALDLQCAAHRRALLALGCESVRVIELVDRTGADAGILESAGLVAPADLVLDALRDG
ncbi:hypothetical protein MMUC44124_26545 [Mycolicibacterium mucogenicum DSM 44124]|uniref:Uncharacterized protein n=1 Tax=Mycolicibacterium mucogenicum DSM 44124 TaxID=1226753 RepID=A0A8H2JI49_MYCMU|nr:hypothetical protein MMUC44124_26545 [Mycolicibacterium mucogenicum DSM 44124]